MWTSFNRPTIQRIVLGAGSSGSDPNFNETCYGLRPVASTFSVHTEPGDQASLGPGQNLSRRSGRSRRSRSASPGGALGRLIRRSSAWLLMAIVALCPLFAGTVHRPVIMAMLAASSLAFFCLLVGERLDGGQLRGAKFSLPLVLLVLLPLLQIVPLPLHLRRLIDPAGSALLDNGPDGTPTRWPLSLDPSSTQMEVGTAAAALVAFVVALNCSTRRRYRSQFLRAIALAGIAGVTIGIVHRLAGIEKLYGIFNVTESVLPGPFINPNHSAEFFELAAFAGLSLALGTEAEARIAWYVAATINAASALSTLSRGSFLALFAGGVVFLLLRWRADSDAAAAVGQRPGAGPLARTLVWTVAALACLVSIAVALGAAPAIDELARTNLSSNTEKIVVWRDSLPLLAHHPLGIGRHAFDRVYPVYKTLTQNSRFQFVENGPLQMIIDLGWPGAALLLVSIAWVLRKAPTRRDYVGAALAAGLVAVLAHNLVDFGLETMGIRLPFVTMAGVLVGRTWGRDGQVPEGGDGPRWVRASVIATAALGLVVGVWAEAHNPADQLEQRWRQAPPGEARLAIALEGGRRYPTDFYFPLLQSYDEPLRPTHPGGVSPRLDAINRALRLCPSCASVYEQAAHALIRLDLRSQALSTYREVVRRAPGRLLKVLAEVDGYRFAPAQIASLAVGGGADTLTVARYLVAKKAEPEVNALLEEAASQGVPPAERLLIKGQLLVALNRLREAAQVLEAGQEGAPRDGRFEEALAQIAELQGQPARALDHARAATILSPFAVDYARRRVRLVLQLRAWNEIEDALEKLKVALRQDGQNVAEVNMAAGQVQAQRGNLARAILEYRTAAALDSSNPDPWRAMGGAAEAGGDTHTAADAYRHVLVLRPGDQDAQQAVVRVEKARDDARLHQLLPGGSEHL